jgi:5-formyltetrahydrofolate cyclo-ligase
MTDRASLKSDLRRVLLKKRNALLKEKVEQNSGDIVTRILSDPRIDLAGTVALYSSINNEVLIESLIDKVGRAVFPRVEQEGRLSFCRIDGLNQLKPGNFNILEPPAETEIIDYADIDLVFVPGCGYTLDGCRLGYGGGYYDRLFSIKPQISRIAPAFETQIVDEIPTEKHDVRVDMLVTEQRVVATVDYRKERP